MMMKMENGWLYIKDADSIKTAIFKSWGLLKWNRSSKLWEGQVCRDLLNRLASISPLTPPVEAGRRRLNEIQEAVDKERILPAGQLKPLAKYPVTKNLYAHQTRAANMALLVFGVADPKEVLDQ